VALKEYVARPACPSANTNKRRRRFLAILDVPGFLAQCYHVLLHLNVVQLPPDCLLKPTKRQSAFRMKQMTRSTAMFSCVRLLISPALQYKRIITGSGDHTAKVWEAADGKELLTLKGHSDQVRSVAFSRDDQRIATGSDDKTAEVWNAASPKQVAVWQEEERAADQHLAALQRERTGEADRQVVVRARDSIKQWLIFAPIPLANGQSGTAGLDIEQIQGEGQLRPRTTHHGFQVDEDTVPDITLSAGLNVLVFKVVNEPADGWPLFASPMLRAIRSRGSR